MVCGRVVIPDFGIFELRRRRPTRARNPRTGERIEIPARTVVRFKPAATLKTRAEAANPR
jgi:nucleoid DNA-binding protein